MRGILVGSERVGSWLDCSLHSERVRVVRVCGSGQESNRLSVISFFQILIDILPCYSVRNFTGKHGKFANFEFSASAPQLMCDKLYGVLDLDRDYGIYLLSPYKGYLCLEKCPNPKSPSTLQATR